MTVRNDSVSSLGMVRRAACGSAMGTAVESYDFLVYGSASALVFGPVFFSELPASLGVVLSFATFSAGFLARPVGAAIFGSLGDALGRRRLLVVSLAGSGTCTMAMGLLPTHAQIGAVAPLLLVGLRLLQGVFHGGEQGGAILMAVEHAPGRRRGWYGSWAFLGLPGGVILAASALGVAGAATGADFLIWGWRLPFLFSIVLVGIGLAIRLLVSETPVFAELRRTAEDRRTVQPLRELLRRHGRAVTAGVGMNLGLNAVTWILTSFVLAYGTGRLGLERGTMVAATMVGAGAWLVSTLVSGWLSDRVGRTAVLVVGGVVLTVSPTVMFALLDTGRTGLVFAAVACGFVGLGVMFGPLPASLVSMFPSAVAYSAVGVTYAVGAVLGGGLSPLIASVLVGASGGSPSTLTVYMSLLGVVTLGCVLWRRRLLEEGPEPSPRGERCYPR